MNDLKEKVTVIDGRYARCQIMHINNILSLVEKSIINDEENEHPIENIENTIDALTEEITNLKYRYKYTIERSVKEEE